MRCELLVEREPRCRRAKSARFYELRGAVYTDLSWWFVHSRRACTKRAAAGWPRRRRRGELDDMRWAMLILTVGAALRGPGAGRRRAAGLAIAAASGRRPSVRRPGAELESRTPRRRPGRSAGTAGLCGGRATVVFAGMLAGRPVVSLAHPGGLHTSYEPVLAAVRVGQPVTAGTAIGELAAGHPGCAARGVLALGRDVGSGRPAPTTSIRWGY